MTIGRIPSVEGGIQPTIFDAKADILTATAADTPARLAVGANDTVLTADSTTATGLKWATPSSGGMTLLASGSATGTATSVNITGLPTTYNNLYVVVRNFKSSVDGRAVCARLNSDSNTRYAVSYYDYINGTFGANRINMYAAFDNTVSDGLTVFTVWDYANTSTWKMITGATMGNNETTNTSVLANTFLGCYNQTSAITDVNITADSGNITCSYLVYGVK